MMDRPLYTLPLRLRLLRWFWPLLKLPLKLLVPLYAIRGNYPWWMVTPDDPVSPFGSGTTPTASTEPSQVALYEDAGRYIGDVVWLGWRNSFYGFHYQFKPDWLKSPGVKYEELVWYRESDGNTSRIYLQQPDGTWLWETTRKLGPFFLITGWRIGPAYEGALENSARAAVGLPRVPRPAFHPNMDGRPVFSIRTRKTL